jgi:excisionase family DNA binding protein
MNKCQVMPGPKQEFYSIDAAATYLTIGTTTIYKAIQQRQIRHVRYGKGKSIRISHNDLSKWVEEQTKPTLAELKAKKHSGQFKRRQPIPYTKEGRIGRPPLWPPTTISDLRRLAKRIEKKMLKEEATGGKTIR